LRTALKILVPLSEAEVKDENDLYNYIRSIRWDKYMQVQDTLAVDVAMKTNIFRHTQFIAQRVKDAIVDQFRDKYGTRPSVDLDRPALRINVYISDRTIKLSRDSSGDSLHRRGYRVKQGPAPMNEVLAAGLIRLSGWNGSDPLVDFMCGSGTIAIEAALSACCIPPGDLRKDYGFQKWKDYDPKLFYDIVNENKKAGDVQRILVYASDIDPETVKLAMRHAQNAGVSKLIDFQTCHFKDLTPPHAPGIIITNPPYGERIVQQNLNELYTQLGDRLKSAYAGYDAWIISANAEAVKHVGLRPSRKITIFNGQLECRFSRYSLYEGSKKAGKTTVS
jgi:putative N6-adenine-specific DNA methylase